MHRHLIACVLAGLSACSSSPSPGAPDEVARLLDDPNPETQARLVAMGDDAVPALVAALNDPAAMPGRLSRTARALGRIRQKTGSAAALEGYVAALPKATDDDRRARAFLEEAHRFRDPQGKVAERLVAAIKDMRVVTPGMIASAGVLTDAEALEGTMWVVAGSSGEAVSPTRDLALRYIGRAARRERKGAADFLSRCTQSPNPDMAAKAGEELKLVAGHEALKGWRAWWFDHQPHGRRDWLAESFGPVGGRPFDPTDRAHLGELVARIPLDRDAEPEMWFLEKACDRTFGYLSPRDAFDPEVDHAKLAESNRAAIETARTWWAENSPYLYYRFATSRFEISEDGRRIGVPVHPKTGKPGQ
jgi:hypothetical protein